MIVVLLTACKSDIVRNDLQEGSWTIDGRIYNALTVKAQDTGNTVTATTVNSDGLVFYFVKLPTSNGNYNIVQTPGAQNEVKIIAVLQDTTAVYSTTGLQDKQAKVSFNDGLMTINVPPVEAENVNVAGDKVTIQALLTEK